MVNVSGGKSKTTCLCSKEYFDQELGFIEFVCEEKAIEDGLCVFHHPTYWEKHQDEIREKFYEKVRKAVEKEDKLVCIGYNLPKIELERLKFKSGVYFNYSQFHQDALFDSVGFLKYAIFEEAFFSGNANFGAATFSNYADFAGTTFLRGANFSGAVFSGDSRWGGAIFSGQTSFALAKFSGYAIFGCTFNGHTSFARAQFLGDTEFECCFFPGFPIVELNVHEFIAFRGAYFEKQDRVRFDRVDMGKVSLEYVDVSRVKFANIQWEEYRGGYSLYDQKILMLGFKKRYRKKYFEQAIDRLRKLRNNENELRDAVREAYWMLRGSELDKKVEEVKKEIDEALKRDRASWEKSFLNNFNERFSLLTIDDVLSIYRTLRENYDYYLRYEESGKFFIGEMDIIRGFKGPIEKAILTAYKWLCLYGESFMKPVLWSLATIIGFALIPLLEAGFPSEYSTLISLLKEGLKESVATFFQMYQELKWSIIAERILSFTILGSLYISLRRRLERKMRH